MTSPSYIDPVTDPEVLPPPTLVEDREGLAALVELCEAASEIAVDTEADSFYSYREKVCLVQVTVAGEDFLIDPLGDLDLAPLAPVFADPDVVKIFHDGEFDVTILGRECDLHFQNIFDTRIAAAALGYSSPGLAAVIERYFGISIDKSEQRSDWSRRPLSSAQVEYARLDTRYLGALKERMQADLIERDRLVVLTSECERLATLEVAAREFDPADYAKIKGARRLSRLEQSVLRELFVLRDKMARERDVPSFKVLGNSVLLTLAQRMPKGLGALEGLKGFPRGRMRSLGRDVLAAVERGRANGPIERAPVEDTGNNGRSRLEDPQFELHERLREWRRDRSDSEGMDASLVLNRHVLLRLALARPKDLAAVQATEGLLSWQRDRYGDELLALVQRFERELAAGEIDLERRRRRR